MLEDFLLDSNTRLNYCWFSLRSESMAGNSILLLKNINKVYKNTINIFLAINQFEKIKNLRKYIKTESIFPLRSSDSVSLIYWLNQSL